MRVCVGRILGPHGVRGLLRVESFTADPAALATYRPLTDEAGATVFALDFVGQQKGKWLVKARGVEDRDAAERLAGTRLFVDREALPATEADEFYHADLVGRPCVRPDGTALGTVNGLYDFGAGTVVEITLQGGKSAMVPFDRRFVPEIAPEGGPLTIDAPDLTEPAVKAGMAGAGAA